MLNAFGDPDADAAVRAERALLGELHGGCSVPVGALRDPVRRRPDPQRAGDLPGRTERVTGTVTGTARRRPARSSRRSLRERGADAILDEIREPAAR